MMVGVGAAGAPESADMVTMAIVNTVRLTAAVTAGFGMRSKSARRADKYLRAACFILNAESALLTSLICACLVVFQERKWMRNGFDDSFSGGMLGCFMRRASRKAVLSE